MAYQKSSSKQAHHVSPQRFLKRHNVPPQLRSTLTPFAVAALDGATGTPLRRAQNRVLSALKEHRSVLDQHGITADQLVVVILDGAEKVRSLQLD